MGEGTVVLNAILTPGTAEVVWSGAGASDDGLRAAFRLSGLPRIEGLLVGRPVASIPSLVERLCGICPASHHLAGVAALEALSGLPSESLSATAVAVRRLLHHATVLEAHAERLEDWARSTGQDGAVAQGLRTLGRQAERAAGGPGHFPVCAVPGGVRAPVLATVGDELARSVAELLPALDRLTAAVLDAEAATAAAKLPTWTGLDLALVDESGAVDLLGSRAQLTDQQGHRMATLRPEDWPSAIRESRPGTPTPRPYLVELGPERGSLRVGPAAQLSVGWLSTPRAAGAQERWRTGRRSAAAARAVLALHCLEVLAHLLADPALVEGPLLADGDGSPTATDTPTTTGTGWIDGQRGVLAHTYTAGADGQLTQAQILTPTANNELWLAHLLTGVLATTQALGTKGPNPASGAIEGTLRDQLEAAILEADPCLPCTSMPQGTMAISIVPADKEA